MNLIFFDIDGTLLPEGQKEISKNILKEIELLKNDNTEIFICTGRCYNQAKEYISALDINNYITSNGQEVCYNGKVIYIDHIKQEQCKQIIDPLRKNKLMWAFETRIGLNVMNEFKEFKLAEMIEGYGFVNVSYTEKVSDEIFQFWVFGEKKQLDNYIKSLNGKFNYYRWNEKCAEIMPLNHSKGSAISIVKNHVKQNTKTFGFGDGVNDIEMLCTVDHSFAMKNAIEDVKKVAEYTCGECSEDGLISGIEILRRLR